MGNFYGQYIGFGSSSAAEAAGVFYGERGVVGGGYQFPETNIIEYITISSTGNMTDFGDLTEAKFGLAACSSGTRGVFGGGKTLPPVVDTIEYITIGSTGNANDFEDLSQARWGLSSGSNGIRGLWCGGTIPSDGAGSTDIMDYVTISTLAEAQDFGNLTARGGTIGNQRTGAISNATRCVIGGGQYVKDLDFVTVATLGDATTFGDLITARGYPGTVFSLTRGVWGGGSSPAVVNVIEYITIASEGDALDFGDLTGNRTYGLNGCSNLTRGVFCGGYEGGYTDKMDYITIATPGNALDFGDLSAGRGETLGACSGD